jgi:hypothetical protein
MHRFRLISIVAAALLFGTSVTLAAQDDSATVGWLLREIAITRGMSAPTEAGAAQVLKAAGVALPSLDPAKSLTEQDVVAIAKSFGIDAKTRNPNAPFTKSRGHAFLATFGNEIGSAGDDQGVTRQGGGNGNGTGPGNGNGNGPPFDPFSKGKKKGHNRSESDPL